MVARLARLGSVLLRHRSTAALSGSVAIAIAGVAGYVDFLARYSINGVYWDEWNWVELTGRSYDGSLTLGDLWVQHNENRMFFPNAIALLVGNVTGFSDIGFICVGAAFLGAAVVLLIVACRNELVGHPLAYLPAMFLFLSLAQYENFLWGFQFAWFMAVACIAGVLLLLTATDVKAWRFLVAVAIGIVASYSVLQGLTIWAAGLLALMRPGISNRLRIAWCAAGALVGAFYLHDLDFASLGGPPLSEFPSRLSTAIEGFFVAVGSVVPDVRLGTKGGPDLSMTVAFGVTIVIAGCFVVASWIMHGRSDRVLTVAAALIVVGLQFDLLLMPGRLSTDLLTGTLSRYTTFNLLLLGGVYIGAVRTAIIPWGKRSPSRIAMSGAFAGLTLALVCLQVVMATGAGVVGGITTHAYHAEAADLTANYATAPEDLVAVFAYPPSYRYFEAQAAFLEANQLNVFGDGESDGYKQTGVLAGGIVSAPLPVPEEFGNVRSNATQWRAWLALSSVYEQRPDLQKAFPGPTMQASREMVRWALRFGVAPTDGLFAPVLQPYAPQYKTWLAEET